MQGAVLTEGGAEQQISIRGLGLGATASFDMHNGSVDLRERGVDHWVIV